MKLFSCCIGPAAVSRPSLDVHDTVQARMNRLTVSGYSSSKERIRQAARVMVETNDETTSQNAIADFRTDYLQTLAKDMLVGPAGNDEPPRSAKQNRQQQQQQHGSLGTSSVASTPRAASIGSAATGTSGVSHNSSTTRHQQQSASLATRTSSSRKPSQGTTGSAHESTYGSSAASQVRIYGFAMLACIARNDDNKRAILESAWLMEATESLIRSEPSGASDVRVFAMDMLREISTLKECCTTMIQSLAWLLDLIEFVLDDEPARSEVRVIAFKLLKNLVAVEELKSTIFNRTSLMELTARIIIESESAGSDVRTHAMSFLWSLGDSKETKVTMMRFQSIMSAIQAVLETEETGSSTKSFAFGLLQHLASARENKVGLFHTNWLMASTRKTIREEAQGSEIKAKAYGMLWNLAISRHNQPEMLRTRWLMDLIERTVARESAGSPVKANAFGLLWSIAGAEENKVEMYKMKNLMEVTERCLREERPSSEVRANALGMLSEIAVAEENKQDMLRTKSLMDNIKRVLEEEPVRSESKAQAFGLLWNLALCRSNQVTLINMDWVMVHCECALRDEPMNSEARANVFALLWNLAVADENKSKMFSKRWVMNRAVDAIKAYEPGKNDEVCANAFGLLQNLAGTTHNQVEMFRSTPLMDAVQRVLDVLYLTRPTGPNSITPSSTPKMQNSGRSTPSTLNLVMTPVGGSSTALAISQNEVIVNCLGLLQNMAFADSNKEAMLKFDWLIYAVQRIIQEAPAGSEVKANAFGMLWNLAGESTNQTEMLRHAASSKAPPSAEPGRFKWLLPTTERVLRDEFIGSSVKTYALGMLKELSSSDENRPKMRRMSWVTELAERVIRDEPVGSEAKVNVLGMLGEISADADCGRLPLLLNLTEQIVKEETSLSPVKLMAFQWLQRLAKRDEATAVRLLDKHPGMVLAALRCYQSDDALAPALIEAIDALLFQVARHHLSRAKLLVLAPNFFSIIQNRLMSNNSATSSASSVSHSTSNPPAETPTTAAISRHTNGHLALALGMLASASESISSKTPASTTSIRLNLPILSSLCELLFVRAVSPSNSPAIPAVMRPEDREGGASSSHSPSSQVYPKRHKLVSVRTQDVARALLGLTKDSSNALVVKSRITNRLEDVIDICTQEKDVNALRLLARLVHRLLTVVNDVPPSKMGSNSTLQSQSGSGQQQQQQVGTAIPSRPSTPPAQTAGIAISISPAGPGAPSPTATTTVGNPDSAALAASALPGASSVATAAGNIGSGIMKLLSSASKTGTDDLKRQSTPPSTSMSVVIIDDPAWTVALQRIQSALVNLGYDGSVELPEEDLLLENLPASSSSSLDSGSGAMSGVAAVRRSNNDVVVWSDALREKLLTGPSSLRGSDVEGLMSEDNNVIPPHKIELDGPSSNSEASGNNNNLITASSSTTVDANVVVAQEQMMKS